MQVNTREDTISNIASYYGVEPKLLRKHYKHEVSGFKQWVQLTHAEDYCIYPENITESISIGEVSLSKGEFYTILTSKKPNLKNKKSLIAVINGTEAKTIQLVLEKIAISNRTKIKEVTMDMARNMGLAIKNSFPDCTMVIDCFHIVKLVLYAMQHLRVKLRWDAIEQENESIAKAKKEGSKYQPTLLLNGDTLKELLARSRYLLYKLEVNWTLNQKMRAEILFEKYPLLKASYKLTLEFRAIYKLLSKEDARVAFNNWKQKVIESGIKEFNTCVNSLEYHIDNILNFYNNRVTNANAEPFNSIINNFRANLRGVIDVRFFLFRLEKLFT